MKRITAAIFVILLFCSGCSHEKTKEKPLTRHLAQKITISCHSGNTVVTHSYSSDTSMSEILQCIRTLELTVFAPSDSENAPGTRYEVIVFCSDGSQYQYVQNAGRYFQSRGIWMKLPQEQAQLLPILFYHLQQDPV